MRATSLEARRPIELRPCGNHALKLPVLGMGCWSYGDGEYWGPHSQEVVDHVVRLALEHGCNFFDTAEAYNGGASEESLGRALQGIPRHHVLIATKINPGNTAPAKLVAHCEASLRRLQTDYLDIYMVHWPITPRVIGQPDPPNSAFPSVPEVFAALARMKREGKIRYLGVSNFGPARLEEALATGVEIVLNELPYSLLTRAIELEMLPLCRSKGVGVVGYMALLQGVLADAFPTLADVPVWRRRTRHFDSRRTPQCRHGLPGAEPETNAALQRIRAISQSQGLTMAALALKWSFARQDIVTSLCGCRTVRHLKDNLEAAAEPLRPEIVEELNRATQPLLEKLGSSFDYYEHPANDRTR